MKTFINTVLLIFIAIAIGSCSSFGTVSKSFSYSKAEIWSATTAVIDKNYGGTKKINPDPPTIVSNLAIKDKKFGIDKTAYQAFAGLTGFNRPFVLDVEVRAYPSGEEGKNYTIDREKAQEIIDQVGILMEHRKFNSSLQDQYEPY
ncbi:MAG: hypothetical protein NTY22_01590 [Proteobacteria bacterium]|nr:hypothetical protein [Pseudomonadota bacterium]